MRPTQIIIRTDININFIITSYAITGRTISSFIFILITSNKTGILAGNDVSVKLYTLTFFLCVDETNRESASIGNEREVQPEKEEESLKASSRRGKNFA